MTRPLIAVVNDDAGFLALMADLLEGEGYRAVVWAGGQGAVEMVKRERPALLILDLRMEQVDEGIAVLTTLRLDPATAAVPVLLCSADGRFLAENAARLATLGVRTLAKPFDLDALLAMIGAMLDAGAMDAEVSG